MSSKHLLKSEGSTAPKANFCQEISDDELIAKLANYGAYHNNLWNKVIHIICVPMVMWSFLFLFRKFGVIYTNDFLDSVHLELTGGSIIILAYIIFYLWVGKYVVTCTYNMILIAMTMNAHWLYKLAPSYWWLFLILGQVVGWTGQLLFGHYLIEHSPAAVVGLSAVDSVMMAPVFSWWEVLFFLGYDKQFRDKLELAIQKKIDELHPHWGPKSSD